MRVARNRIVRLRKVFAALALIGGLLGGLVLCEFGTRLYLLGQWRRGLERSGRSIPSDPSATVTIHDLIQRLDDPELIYRFKPGARGALMGVPIALNSLGLRDEELPAEKPPDELRVVGLGDSTMFGWAVPDGERYVDRIEAGLETAFDGRPVNVIPVAVPGYMAVQEIEAFHRLFDRLRPDVVFIQFDQNDIDLTAALFHPRFLSADKFYLLRLKQVLAGTLLAEELRKPEMVSIPEESRHLLGWPALEESYRRLRDFCRTRSIPLLVLMPLRHDLDFKDTHEFEDTRRYARFLEICGRLELAVVDPNAPSPRLQHPERPAPGDIELFIPDGHPSSLGHAFLASALFPPLFEQLAEGRLEPEARVRVLERWEETSEADLRIPRDHGLHDVEDWGGIQVRWTQRRARLRIEPAGKTLVVTYYLAHPDLSPRWPVTVTLAVCGGPPHRFEHTTGGYFTERIPLPPERPGDCRLEIELNRAWREPSMLRSLGLALYPLRFED